MARQTVKANLLLLDRFNSLIFNGERVWAPLWKGSAKQLAEALDRLAADEIVVQFSTLADEKIKAKDIKAYTRRLEKLAGYQFSGFANKVIRGYVQDATFTGTLRRVAVSEI